VPSGPRAHARKFIRILAESALVLGIHDPGNFHREVRLGSEARIKARFRTRPPCTIRLCRGTPAPQTWLDSTSASSHEKAPQGWRVLFGFRRMELRYLAAV